MARGTGTTTPTTTDATEATSSAPAPIPVPGRHAGPWGASFDGTEPDGVTRTNRTPRRVQ